MTIPNNIKDEQNPKSTTDPLTTTTTTTKKNVEYRRSNIQLPEIRTIHPEIYGALKSLSSARFSKHGAIWFGRHGFGGTQKYFIQRMKDEGTIAIIETMELTPIEKEILMGLCLYGGGRFATYDDLLEYFRDQCSSKGV